MPLPTAPFLCCRSHDLFAPVEEYPVAFQRTSGDEACWFDWDSTNSGNATPHLAKLGTVSHQRCPP